MAEYKNITSLSKQIRDFKKTINSPNSDYMTGYLSALSVVEGMIAGIPSADVVEVVRCRDCKFATELDVHCEFNRKAYKHCSLLRGDETRNVWHKYKKYYKDYSIVELDEFCSYGERKCEE